MRERVGARHWLFLGMLAQMPGESMHLRSLSHLAHAISPGVNVKPTVEVLRQKELVTFNPQTQMVTLTERGATRRRQSGRPDTPYFARVPRQFMKQAS